MRGAWVTAIRCAWGSSFAGVVGVRVPGLQPLAAHVGSSFGGLGVAAVRRCGCQGYSHSLRMGSSFGGGG
jgi:hypothetical protein